MVAARVSPTCFPVAAGVMGRGAMMVLTVLALKLTSHARVSIGRNVVCSCFSCDEVRVVQGGAGRALQCLQEFQAMHQPCQLLFFVY